MIANVAASGWILRLIAHLLCLAKRQALRSATEILRSDDDFFENTESMNDHFRDFLHSLVGTLLAVGLLMLLLSCSSLPKGEPPSVSPLTEKVSFETQIKPLFESRCVMCHNGHVAAGDLNLLTRDLAFRRSSNGPFIIPGDPEGSKLFRMVRLADVEPGAMPPTGHALGRRELSLIKAWIEQGAAWPVGEAGYLKATDGMNWRSR